VGEKSILVDLGYLTMGEKKKGLLSGPRTDDGVFTELYKRGNLERGGLPTGREGQEFKVKGG